MGKDNDEGSYGDHQTVIKSDMLKKGKLDILSCDNYDFPVSLWVISSKQNYTANPKNYLAILKLL